MHSRKNATTRGERKGHKKDVYIFYILEIIMYGVIATTVYEILGIVPGIIVFCIGLYHSTGKLPRFLRRTQYLN